MRSVRLDRALRFVLVAFAFLFAAESEAQDSFGVYQKQGSTQCTVSTIGNCLITFPAVPLQRVLRVEYVNCGIDLPSSGVNISSVGLSVNGVDATANLPFSAPASAVSGKRSIIAHGLNFVLTAQKAPRVGATFTGSGQAKLDCTVTGTLLRPIS